MDIEKLVYGVVIGIVGIVVIFYLVGSLAPTLVTASDNISNSGLPLAGLFSSGGIVMIIIVVGILLTIIGLAFRLKQK